MQRKAFKIGDIVRMKKKHPCGSFNWKVTRMGADIKMKCVGCGRIVMIPRMELKNAWSGWKSRLQSNSTIFPPGIEYNTYFHA